MTDMDDVPGATPHLLMGRWELREGPRDGPPMTGFEIDLVFSTMGMSEDAGPIALQGLPDSGTVTGRSGVNRFQGNYWSAAEPEGESGASGILAFGPLGVTLMAGPPAAMLAEHAFLQMLSRVRGYRVRGSELDLFGDSGVLLARMERVGPTNK